MPSGISAQGSTLEISTGSGSAKTITAITIGFPAIATSAAHSLTNGTPVMLAGIVGTMSVLNGSTRVIANVTANTFALLDANTTGLTYTSGGTATPVTYTKINGVKSFSGLDGATPELDVTDLDSTAMEYIGGLRDEGKFGFDMKVLKTDTGQIALRAARTSAAIVGLRLTLPDASTATFSVLVKSIPTTAETNAVLKTSVDTKITGPVVYA